MDHLRKNYAKHLKNAAILFPGEAHRTKEAAAAPGKVGKAVCKVLWKK